MRQNALASSDSALVEELFAIVRRGIVSARAQWHGAVGPDAVQDMEQETRLVLWKALPRLKQLCPEVRAAYARRCAQRAAQLFLRREVNEARRLSAFNEDSTLPPQQRGSVSNMPGAYSNCPVFTSPQHLTVNLHNLPVAAAFDALSSGEQWIVLRAVIWEWSDVEVAEVLLITPAAAKKRRQRAVLKMRRRFPVCHTQA